MDKRDLSSLFRAAAAQLVQRSDLNQSAFAASIGIDRSALSQMLSEASTRLPRAETLLTIAAEHQVSLDWLMGLSQDEGLTGEIRESLEIEEGSGGFDARCSPNGTRRPPAPRSATCRPAFPTCCAARR